MSYVAALKVSRSAERAMRTAFGRFWIARTSAELPEQVRLGMLASHCQDFRYYEVIERTLAEQFTHRYLVLENEATGEVAAQPFFFVEQDLLAGLSRRLRECLGGTRRIFPRAFIMRVLMVGCAAGEGRLADTQPWAVSALHEALAIYGQKARVSLVVLKDFPAAFRNELTPFSANGYRRIPSMPAAKLELNFASFEDFVQRRLSRSFRKNLRRKFRKLEGRSKIVMEVVQQIDDPCLEEVFALYRQTFARSKFQFERLTKGYLGELGEKMPDRVRYFLWRQEGKLVAFSLCMVHQGVLYDLALGLDYPLALELHLYFVTWRDMVQWAIEQGLQSYRTGPLNYDPKLHLRLQLAPLDLYVRHTSTLLNPLLHRTLVFLQPTRHDPILRKLANS
jgi:Acetyltransferase (GNAT) domain